MNVASDSLGSGAKERRSDKQVGRIQGFWLALVFEGSVALAVWMAMALVGQTFSALAVAGTLVMCTAGMGALVLFVWIHDQHFQYGSLKRRSHALAHTVENPA